MAGKKGQTHRTPEMWTALLRRHLAGESAARIAAAQDMRARIYDAPFYRLIHAEADGLPGVVIDRFGDTCVVQPNAAWAELHIEPLAEALVGDTVFAVLGYMFAQAAPWLIPGLLFFGVPLALAVLFLFILLALP